MMIQQSVASKQGLHHRVLIAALIVFAQDLSSRGRAQAWTYNYSTSPSRRWTKAREWCQQNFIDLVTVKSQEESDFLNNLVPFNPNYYWIGVRRIGVPWSWAETREPLPEEALRWATGEPDNQSAQDCVEIYIKRETETAKWNNENCFRKKGAICYSASCKNDSCSAHADCVETIGNYTCQCHPGFLGSDCEEAIACKPLLDPEQGSHICFHPYGSNRFNSSCLFHCELGFQLVGVPQLLCQASGHWDHPVPLCQVQQCPVLNHTNIGAGSMNCSHPIAPYSYSSTCEVRCDQGYKPSGPDHIRCDHTGQWTASVPTCTLIKCSPILFPATGNMTCVDILEPFSFGSQCNFTCQEGYYLTGDNALTCLASGQWSKPPPSCTVVQCNRLKAPAHASMQCQDPRGVYSFGSICITQCDEGFDLIGTNITKCSAQGIWSNALPVCQVKRCNPVNPSHGSLSCSDPNGSFSFGSKCTTTCDKGFLLNGTASIECNSQGRWSADIPRCFAKRCPTVNSSHGYLTCSDPHEEFSFGSRCNITCDEGFVLNGTADTECTSLSTWSPDIPHCLAKRCPTVNSPSHGSIICSDPHEEFSFGSRCNITCDEGFVLNGTADTECTSMGTWTADIPHCLAKRCPTLNSPLHGSLFCSDPNGEFSFGSRCTSACEDGFVLNGTADVECTSLGLWTTDTPHCSAKKCSTLNAPLHGSLFCSAPHDEFSFGSQCKSTCEEGFVLDGMADTECTSLGTWSADVPRCLAKRCSSLYSPFHGSLSCSAPHGEFSFGSRCTSTCEKGFVLNGTADTECTSLGTWSRQIPACLALPCPLLAMAPQDGSMNCSHPYSPFSYGSHCDFECNEGFWLRGPSSMTCNNSGQWSEDLPTCQLVQCEAIGALSLPLSMTCSHPAGNFSFGSKCVFTCEEGFSLNGTDMLSCSSTGFWSDSLPQCTVEDMPVGAAMVANTGVVAASVVVPLVLIGLGVLIVLRFKKKAGNPIMSDAPAWGDRENPAFEF